MDQLDGLVWIGIRENLGRVSPRFNLQHMAKHGGRRVYVWERGGWGGGGARRGLYLRRKNLGEVSPHQSQPRIRIAQTNHI